MSALVAELIRARGFVALTTPEAGQVGVSDAAQLEYAVSRGKALLTHNRADFEALARQYFSTGRTHYGIIIAVRRPPYDIVRRRLVKNRQETADEMKIHCAISNSD